MIDVDEVEPCGFLAKAHLARPGVTDFNLGPLEHFGAPGLLNLDRVGHSAALQRPAVVYDGVVLHQERFSRRRKSSMLAALSKS